jgi:hypothetical protein
MAKDIGQFFLNDQPRMLCGNGRRDFNMKTSPGPVGCTTRPRASGSWRALRATASLICS